MKPRPDMALLGRAVVKQGSVPKWFVWFPGPMVWLGREAVQDRGVRQWVVASVGAPRWA